MRFPVLAFCVACLLSACSDGPPPLSSGELAVQPMHELPAPTPDGAREYRIGPFDTIVVDVYGVEGLDNREIQADASGRVSFPLAGSIDARGMTLDTLSREIETRLKQYIIAPHVSVNVKDAQSHLVTVDGEVKEPGSYAALGDMTLMRIIARAKGTTQTAKLTEVVVFRNVGDKHYAALYDLASIRAGRYADPAIYPNDIVIVGDSPARRRFLDILQVAPLLTTPLVVLLQQL